MQEAFCERPLLLNTEKFIGNNLSVARRLFLAPPPCTKTVTLATQVTAN